VVKFPFTIQHLPNEAHMLNMSYHTFTQTQVVGLACHTI